MSDGGWSEVAREDGITMNTPRPARTWADAIDPSLFAMNYEMTVGGGVVRITMQLPEAVVRRMVPAMQDWLQSREAVAHGQSE